MRKKIEREFKRLAQQIAKRLQQEGKELQEDINELLLKSHNIFVEYIVDGVRRIKKYGNKVMISELEIEVDWNLLNKQAVDYMNGIKDLHLSQKKGSILVTTQQGIAKVIAKGIQDGKTYPQIADDILKLPDAGVLSKARAQTIAVHQLGTAYERGRHEVVNIAKGQGMNFEKIRDTVGDDKVTYECNENARQGRIIEMKAFTSGDNEAPRSTNPNCRCTTNYRIVEHGEFYNDNDTTYQPSISR